MDQIANMMTIEQAAVALGRSAATIRNYIKAGKLKSTKVLGRVMLEKKQVLELSSER
jgi:excisionase family DNA binding protein